MLPSKRASVHHDRSESAGQRIGDGVSDEGLCGDRRFCLPIGGLVARRAFMVRDKEGIVVTSHNA